MIGGKDFKGCVSHAHVHWEGVQREESGSSCDYMTTVLLSFFSVSINRIWLHNLSKNIRSLWGIILPLCADARQLHCRYHNSHLHTFKIWPHHAVYRISNCAVTDLEITVIIVITVTQYNDSLVTCVYIYM